MDFQALNYRSNWNVWWALTVQHSECLTLTRNLEHTTHDKMSTISVLKSVANFTFSTKVLPKIDHTRGCWLHFRDFGQTFGMWNTVLSEQNSHLTQNLNRSDDTDYIVHVDQMHCDSQCCRQFQWLRQTVQPHIPTNPKVSTQGQTGSEVHQWWAIRCRNALKSPLLK